MLWIILSFFIGYTFVIISTAMSVEGDRLSKAISGLTLMPMLFVAGNMGVVTFYEIVLADNLIFVAGGALFAGGWIMQQEGVFGYIADWISQGVRPTQGRSQQAFINQLARQSSRASGPVTSSGHTLLGTSTNYLRDHDLDLRSETLIRLCYFAFSQPNHALISTLEKKLNCAYGQRQKNFRSLISSLPPRPNLKQIVRPFAKSQNHHVRSMMALFTELCALAKATRNTDDATMARLIKAGKILGLSDEDMGMAIHRLG